MTTRVASLEAVITANVSGFQQAAQQVKSGLSGIASEAKKTSGVMGAALDPQSKFSQGAEQLTQAWKNGEITAQQYQKRLGNLTWQTASMGEKFQAVRSRIEPVAMSLAKFGAAAVGVGLAGKAIYDFGKAGAQIEYTREKFDRLSKSVGTTGNVFLNDLRVATKGTVSDFDLLKQGSDLLQLGLAKDSTEATRLSKVMTALGMDTGELTLALANQSKRRLDQLGLSLTKFNEIEAKLKSSGMSKEDAFKEAFMQTAEQTIQTTGNRADSNAGAYSRLAAESANYWNQLKETVGNSQFMVDTVSKVAKTLRASTMAMSGDYKWQNPQWNGQTGQIEFDVVRRNKLLEDITAMNAGTTKARQMAGAYGYGYAAPMGINPIRADLGYGRPADRSYSSQGESALVKTYGQRASAFTQYKEPVDYAKQMESIQYTDTFRKYNDDISAIKTSFKDGRYVAGLYKQSMADLHDELKRGDITQEEYNQKTKEMQGQWKDGTFAANEQAKALQNLNVNLGENSNAWALNSLQAKGATEEQQLRFARASGLITDDALEAASGIDKLNKAYMDGRISADTYAQGVQKLGGWVNGLSGKSFDVTIDVWIKVHGSIPNSVAPSGAYAPPSWATPAGWTGSNTPSAPAAPKSSSQAQSRPVAPRWRGGALGGGITIVGDAPGGGFTPYTEAIINGYVVDAKTTRAMRDAGLLDSAKFYDGGGALGGAVFGAAAGMAGYATNVATRGAIFGAGAGFRRRPRRRSRSTSGGLSESESPDSDASAGMTYIPPQPDTMGAVMQIGAQTTQAVSQNFKRSTEMQVQAQRISSDDIVAGLSRIENRIARQPTKDDLYALYKGAQQTNI